MQKAFTVLSDEPGNYTCRQFISYNYTLAQSHSHSLFFGTQFPQESFLQAKLSVVWLSSYVKVRFVETAVPKALGASEIGTKF